MSHLPPPILRFLAGAILLCLPAAAGPVYGPTPDYPPACPSCGYYAGGPITQGTDTQVLGLAITNFTSITQVPSGSDQLAGWHAQATGSLWRIDSFFDVFVELDLGVLEIGRSGNGTGTFSTELLQMNLSGSLPEGVQLRESPTQSSTGLLTVTPVGGSYSFDSFFDVFFEISLDDGVTWLPADRPVRLTLDTPEPSALVLSLAGLLLLAAQRLRRR